MANLKNTVISDAQFRLPVGDNAARPSSPNARQIRFNTETGKLEQFRPGVGDWIAPNNTGIIATGGDAVYDVDVEGTSYRVHVFTSTGTSTFSVLQGGEVEYLIVGGGGGGGGHSSASYYNDPGGGGGAGGLLTGKTSITTQVYSVTVGDAGISNSNTGSRATNGNNSTVFGLTAIGGGGGANGANGGNGVSGGNGGSGGGGAAGFSGGTTGGSGTAGQGNDGGDVPDGTQLSGAGGGAGSVGDDATPESATDGGSGLISFITGTPVFYAGGGAGGGSNRSSDNQTIGGIGGLGGGGNGGNNGVGGATGGATSGTPNTGGGGGGAGGFTSGGVAYTGADGGSGIVVVRYPLRQNNPETAAGQDVRNGLVLDLDFAKPTVYSGSGSTVSDSRLNGIVGTISGPDYINARSHRSAFSFDGGSDVIEIPAENAIMTTNGSLSFWLYADPTGSSYEGIIDSNFYSGSNGGWRFYRYDSVDIRMWESGNAIVYISNAITENAWQHLVLTRSGTTVKIYKNGGEIGSGTSTYGQWDGTLITLGTRYTGASARLNGDLGVVKFYNRAMLESEVEQEFNATRWRFGV